MDRVLWRPPPRGSAGNDKNDACMILISDVLESAGHPATVAGYKLRLCLVRAAACCPRLVPSGLCQFFALVLCVELEFLPQFLPRNLKFLDIRYAHTQKSEVRVVDCADYPAEQGGR